MPPRFDLRTALFGHGFIDLPPNRWSPEDASYHTTLGLGQRAADLAVRQSGSRLVVELTAFRPLGTSQRRLVTRALRHMLRLDEDLDRFRGLCREHEDLGWVYHRHAGALLRGQSPFEDFAKVLLTTNCTWENTRGMVERLVRLTGAEAPSGAHAFPSARKVSRCSESYLRSVIRVGYRAGPLLRLARSFASTTHARRLDELARDEHALRDYVLGLPGFGPYAAGQILRLTGHYRDFALDSWCVATLRKRGFRTASCTERALARRYRRFQEFRGLAFWFDLTAPWHGEGPHADEGSEVLKSVDG